MSESIYENIERLCNERQITVGALCNGCGIRQSVLGELKHGRAKSLTLTTATKIADYLGVSLDRIVGKEPDDRELALEKFYQPKYRILFDTAEDATEEQIATAVKILQALKDE